MIVSKETLLKEAGASGFRPEILEKVLHLLRLLDAIRRHPYLKERLVLKGGTALNLFEFDVPRLSVDINFMRRLPLWPIVLRNSKKIGSFQTQQIPLLDINELAAAKLAALLARHAARDLFDAHQLLTQVKLDDAKQIGRAHV